MVVLFRKSDILDTFSNFIYFLMENYKEFFVLQENERSNDIQLFFDMNFLVLELVCIFFFDIEIERDVM